VSKIQDAICVIRGHDFVSGRMFIDSNGYTFDYRWRACVRCQKWEPEGGIDHFLWEREGEGRKVKDERAISSNLSW